MLACFWTSACYKRLCLYFCSLWATTCTDVTRCVVPGNLRLGEAFAALCWPMLLMTPAWQVAHRDPKQKCLQWILSLAAHPVPSDFPCCYLFSSCSTAVVHRYWDNWYWSKLPVCKMKLHIPGAVLKTVVMSRQLWGWNICCPPCSSWTMQQDGNLQERNEAD